MARANPRTGAGRRRTSWADFQQMVAPVARRLLRYGSRVVHLGQQFWGAQRDRLGDPGGPASLSLESMGARLRHLEERLGMLEKSAAPLPTCSGLCFRTGTMDQGIWRDVVENNEYRLPEQFRPADVLLDIGTHIGAFSYAALVRGAGHVWAFEANAANWLIARQNLRRFEGRVHLVHKAIWRSDRPVASLCYLNSPDPTNTGGGSVYGTERHNAVECLAFDQAVDQALAGSGAPRLRLLKLDCEGSEWPILLTSRRLHLVDGICGEYHASGAHIPPSAQVDGYTEYTPEVLRDFLQKQGFAVHLQPTVTSLGHFWATRTTPPPDC